jgi:hypothetical protein
VITIYDWRPSLCPKLQVFRAGGQSRDGGMTLGGAMVSNPEPGGRGFLRMSFVPFWRGEQRNTDASWTISRLLNGNVMRVKLSWSAQLVSGVALGMAASAGEALEGNPWANEQPWANDENWRGNPWVPVSAPALAGVETFQADLSSIGQILRIGHLVGFFLDGYDFTHEVMDVTYDENNVASISVSPPLRRPLTPTDVMLFRPSMLATCQNPSEISVDSPRLRYISLGPINFVEFIV